MMRLIFILSLFGTLSAQDNVQFNMLMIPSDSGYSIIYEKLDYKKNINRGDRQLTESRDSFLVWLLEDLSGFDEDKRQVLFYVHGMWGGQKGPFNRAYKLLSTHFLEAENSDVARIVSLKWPGNDMDYSDNKGRIPELVPVLKEELTALVRSFQLAQWLDPTTDSSWDLLAHSLGNELIRAVLRDLPSSQYDYPLFDNIIFAASDFDCDVYDTDSLMQNVHNTARQCHIYYSERDLTLEVSKNLNKKDRLGRTGPTNYDRIPVNTSLIDVTLVKDEINFPDLLTGHSYYRASPLVTGDMLQAIMSEKPVASNYRLAKESGLNHFLISPEMAN